jgi:hypothetical protein
MTQDSEVRNNGYKVLSTLQSYAPDNLARDLCGEMYADAFLEGASENEVEKMFVRYLYNGIMNGHWPWTENKLELPVIGKHYQSKKSGSKIKILALTDNNSVIHVSMRSSHWRIQARKFWRYYEDVE